MSVLVEFYITTRNIDGNQRGFYYNVVFPSAESYYAAWSEANENIFDRIINNLELPLGDFVEEIKVFRGPTEDFPPGRRVDLFIKNN